MALLPGLTCITAFNTHLLGRLLQQWRCVGTRGWHTEWSPRPEVAAAAKAAQLLLLERVPVYACRTLATLPRVSIGWLEAGVGCSGWPLGLAWVSMPFLALTGCGTSPGQCCISIPFLTGQYCHTVHACRINQLCTARCNRQVNTANFDDLDTCCRACSLAAGHRSALAGCLFCATQLAADTAQQRRKNGLQVHCWHRRCNSTAVSGRRRQPVEPLCKLAPS